MGCKKLAYYAETPENKGVQANLKLVWKSCASAYRYGFNNKEKDNEISGEGNSYDFGSRIYDPRLAKWLSLDPLSGKYPYHSPYIFAADNPIFFIDADGEDIKPVGDAAKTLVLESAQKVFKTSSVFYINKQGFVAIHKKEYKKAVKNLWNDNQKSIAKDFKEVILSNDYHLRVLSGDNSNKTFSDKVQRPDEVNMVKGKDNEYHELRTQFSPYIATGDTKTPGITVVFPDKDYANYGWVFVNTDELKNLDKPTQQAEGIKQLSPTGTFFHEVLDHFFKFMKTGKLEDKSEPKSKQIENYNKATQETGEGQRTGDKH